MGRELARDGLGESVFEFTVDPQAVVLSKESSPDEPLGLGETQQLKLGETVLIHLAEVRTEAKKDTKKEGVTAFYEMKGQLLTELPPNIYSLQYGVQFLDEDDQIVESVANPFEVDFKQSRARRFGDIPVLRGQWFKQPPFLKTRQYLKASQD